MSYYFPLFPLVALVLLVVSFPSGESFYQPAFAIGATQATYPNYVLYDYRKDLPAFVGAYNAYGGLPSLGFDVSTSSRSCLLDVTPSSVSPGEPPAAVRSCNCAQAVAVNELVPLQMLLPSFFDQPAPCAGHFTASDVQQFFLNVTAGPLAVYRSTLPSNCDLTCLLHGTCAPDGSCHCDPNWSGATCSRFQPPAGLTAHPMTLQWAAAGSSEELGVWFGPTTSYHCASLQEKGTCQFQFTSLPSEQPGFGASPLAGSTDVLTNQCGTTFTVDQLSGSSVYMSGYVVANTTTSLCTCLQVVATHSASYLLISVDGNQPQKYSQQGGCGLLDLSA
mmetsp:Transcript_4663/g.14252  ORF Transcript_4663/g.14252 Transcript_4663/m.14252 type:complete len:334 (+) Transcript_4663:217-1218(+)